VGAGLPRPALERAARELLALQASDWAFMETRELAADYPRERLAAHERELEACISSPAAAHPQLRGLAPDLDLASLTTP
jgi:1,4-alpha-glucan branching enzyme